MRRVRNLIAMQRTQRILKPDSTKGERTRRRLVDAGLSLLGRSGYYDLKTTEVAREAGVAAGVFYIYFKDKDALVLALLDDLFERNTDQIFEGPRLDDPFAAVLAANRRYVSLFAQAGGMNRAIGQIVDALPEARKKWQAANASIAQRIGSAIARRAGCESKERFVFAALALQAMIDAVLLQAFVYDDAALADMARDPDRLAYELSLLWFRAAYGRDPEQPV
jgi:AcrR family transcriptional regulator